MVKRFYGNDWAYILVPLLCNHTGSQEFLYPSFVGWGIKRDTLTFLAHWLADDVPRAAVLLFDLAVLLAVLHLLAHLAALGLGLLVVALVSIMNWLEISKNIWSSSLWATHVKDSPLFQWSLSLQVLSSQSTASGLCRPTQPWELSVAEVRFVLFQYIKKLLILLMISRITSKEAWVLTLGSSIP